MIECGDIPSAAELTEVYEENFKADAKKRVETIKHRLRSKLIEAAESGRNWCLYREDDASCIIATYEELDYFRKELKKLGFRVRLKIDDSWVTRWYLCIRWGKDIDLRDAL